MSFSMIWFDSPGRLFSSFCIIIILTMMFIVTLRLYLSRKKKAYFSITFSITIIILQYVIVTWMIVQGQSTVGGDPFLARMLEVLSFILINMGIYQLYNTTRARQLKIFYSFFGIALVIASFRFVIIHRTSNPTVQFIQFQNIWIDIYLLLLTFLCFYLISPFIGQYIKYQIGICIYAIIQMAYIINHYTLKEAVPMLSFIHHFLPIVFYIILFFIVFERVVELMQAVYRSSIKDGLTGLYNRQFILNRIHQYTERKHPFALLFADIDHFKKLNDTKGHQNGDRVLRQVAEIVMDVCEHIGLAGRYGGEEILVLLIDPSKRVENIAELIRQRVQHETICTISIGCSIYRKGATSLELIEQADQAMYQSKRSGRNRVTLYSEP